jgi:hypothetical protein
MAAKRKSWLGEFWRPLAALLLWVLGMVPLIAAPPLLSSVVETRIGGLTAFPVDCIPAVPLFSSDLTRACGPPLYDLASGCSVAANRGIQVSEKGILRVEGHLSRPELNALSDPANAAMVQRLRSGQATPTDLRFYFHELKESAIMNRGAGARDAHLQTLEWQGIPYKAGYESQLYHPEVILQNAGSFNPAAVRAAEAAGR